MMPLMNIPLEAITQEHLLTLIEDQVPEGKTIDYKQALPGNSYADKREFLADGSSFANAAGGHLVFGVKEQGGVPVELCGLQGINADEEINRLESSIRDGIKPRIPGLVLRPVPLHNGGIAVVVRIPRSWALPHVVDFQGHWRFYARNSIGKYPLDIGEVRAAFALSETTADRLRNFRAERLGLLVAGETPIAVDEGAKMVLHIVPINAFDPAVKFDVASLARDPSRLQPINAMGWSHLHNFDGFLTYTRQHQAATTHTYLQIFRNGSVEAVEAALLSPGESGPIIPHGPYEGELLSALPRFLAIQQRLGVEPPLFVMHSLLGVSGYTIPIHRGAIGIDRGHPIDKDTLIIPEAMVESFECDPAEVLRPIFDAVWNAAGWSRSLNYDQTGKRTRR
jgi:hypothetical protein